MKIVSFKNLKTLRKIIKNENEFQIQLYTLESFEMLEGWLEYQKIEYKKAFASSYDPYTVEFTVLFKDTDKFEVANNSKVILFSNERDRRFVPYKFKLTDDEKQSVLNDRKLYEQNKKLSVCSVMRRKVSAPSFIANNLTYAQCVIVFCLLSETRFNKLLNEIKNVDGDLNNRTNIKLEINELIKHKILTRRNDFCKLNITKETIKEICKRIGLDKVYS
ncbi:hypothetical protein ECANGB1_2009 [Enterospora canceri]|uniref:Uncharacterized protein n=1 Tax=Enterospora canceri TaxID=1081671 RepID=A0A1Y1S5X0_9MICR|nr:hypothetical protein ECANGB1_2009 [Enterospora canceri]